MATKQILSPLPGTFYRKPAPDKPSYKEDGDKVAVGDVIEDAVMAGQPLAEIEV